MSFKPFRLLAIAGYALTAMNYVAAQVPPPVAAPTPAESRSINDWLTRMHEASRKRSYIGTFVVSSGAPCPAPRSGMSAKATSRWNG